MSFADLSRLEGGTRTRANDIHAGSPSPSFAHAANSISRHIFQITTSITVIQRQLSAVSTKTDSSYSRNKLHDLLEANREVVKVTGDEIKQLDEFDEQEIGGDAARFTKNKLKKDFQKVLLSFQQVQRQSAEHQRQCVSQAKAAILEHDMSLDDDHPQQGDLQLQTQQMRLVEDSEIEFNESLIQERETEIQGIEAGITELNEIFRDLGTMITQQGSMIDNIENNIENVAMNTKSASSELSKAQRYQRKSRNRKFCLFGVLVIIFGIVLLAVLLG